MLYDGIGLKAFVKGIKNTFCDVLAKSWSRNSSKSDSETHEEFPVVLVQRHVGPS